MKIKTIRTLVIGSGGYVGSAVARALSADVHDVHGLARSADAAQRIVAAGLTAVGGGFENLRELAAAARDFDCIVFAPSVFPIALELPPLDAILGALEGSCRTFVYTSGTNLFAKTTRDGAWHPMSYSEYDIPQPPAWATAKQACEKRVLAAAERGVRAMVIRPPLIWGNGGSFQVPQVFASVAKTGAACYIGRGLHTYSNVHIDDLAEVYRLAIDRGTAGGVYHAVAGEANYRAIAQAVAEVARCATLSVDYDRACEIWNPWYVMFGLSANSRTRAERTQAELGWAPLHTDLLYDIVHGSYRAVFSG